jgi:hypothetical protein
MHDDDELVLDDEAERDMPADRTPLLDEFLSDSRAEEAIALAAIASDVAASLGQQLAVWHADGWYGKAGPIAVDSDAPGQPHISAGDVCVAAIVLGDAALPAYVFVPLAAIREMTERLFGGPGSAPGHATTAAAGSLERALLQRLLNAFVAAFDDVLVSGGRVRARLGEGAISIQPATSFDFSAGYVALPFLFDAEGPRALDLVLLVPLRRVTALVGKPNGTGSVGNPPQDWTRDWQAAILDLDLPVTAVLAEPVVSLPDLRALCTGGVLAIDLPPAARIDVAGVRVAVGEIGEQAGARAMRLLLAPGLPFYSRKKDAAHAGTRG